MCKLWSIVFYIVVFILILIFFVFSVDCYNYLIDLLNWFCKIRFMIWKKVMMINCLIWFYIVLFVLIFYIDWGDFYYEFFVYDKRCWFLYISSYIIVISFFNFLLFLFIICGIYIKIYCIVSVWNKNVIIVCRCECGKLIFI